MKKYRVEAFIIPINNKCESNQIDDVKIANKLKDQSFTEPEYQTSDDKDEETVEKIVNHSVKEIQNDSLNSSEFSEVFFDINEHIYDEIVIPERTDVENEKPKTEYTKATFKIEEPIYDEPFIGNLTNLKLLQNNENYDVPQTRWTLANSKYRRFGIVAPKIPKRSSSLKSITEDIENFDETLGEVCCHGRKDGCLPKSQRPEDISEEIFKENWMQKLDALRKLETLLKDKEIALQSRERLLFKKEKELKILERLVKDKMRQAELYAKRYKKSLSTESISNNERKLESRSSNGSKGHESLSIPSNFEEKINSKVSLESNDEKVFKNPPNSRSSLASEMLSSRIGSIRTRSRPRQKIRYEDLDSTLSADIGDSSFIKTSEKFDPATFKKPAAFSRSASERRPWTVQQVAASRLCSLIEKKEPVFNELEDKVMEKISKNILASKDLETKFLNYGSIDRKTESGTSLSNKEMENKKRFSYLNLESFNKTIISRLTSIERTTSWSEDTDDWLKKKRQAYNEANKKIATEKTDKENFDGKVKLNKSNKITKKKENHKKFSIFR